MHVYNCVGPGGFIFRYQQEGDFVKKTNKKTQILSQNISILEVVNLTIVILTPQLYFFGDHIRVFQISRRTSKNSPTKITFLKSSFSYFRKVSSYDKEIIIFFVVTDYFYFTISLCIACICNIKKAHGKLVGTIINTKSSTKFVFYNSCIITIVHLHKQKQLNEHIQYICMVSPDYFGCD